MSDDSWRHSLPGPSGMSSGRPSGSGGVDDSENDENVSHGGDSDGRGRESYGSGNEDDNQDSDDNAIEYNTDDSDDDDAPLFGRSGFPHLDPADLVVIQEQLDDMWIGKKKDDGMVLSRSMWFGLYKPLSHS